LEFFHNHNNLRTLCQDCHRQVTSKYLRIKFQVKNKQIS
jgi:5-methylcytosine-specific restriction endonuclease McrA